MYHEMERRQHGTGDFHNPYRSVTAISGQDRAKPRYDDSSSSRRGEEPIRIVSERKSISNHHSNHNGRQPAMANGVPPEMSRRHSSRSEGGEGFDNGHRGRGHSSRVRRSESRERGYASDAASIKSRENGDQIYANTRGSEDSSEALSYRSRRPSHRDEYNHRGRSSGSHRSERGERSRSDVESPGQVTPSYRDDNESSRRDRTRGHRDRMEHSRDSRDRTSSSRVPSDVKSNGSSECSSDHRRSRSRDRHNDYETYNTSRQRSSSRCRDSEESSSRRYQREVVKRSPSYSSEHRDDNQDHTDHRSNNGRRRERGNGHRYEDRSNRYEVSSQNRYNTNLEYTQPQSEVHGKEEISRSRHRSSAYDLAERNENVDPRTRSSDERNQTFATLPKNTGRSSHSANSRRRSQSSSFDDEEFLPQLMNGGNTNVSTSTMPRDNRRRHQTRTGNGRREMCESRMTRSAIEDHTKSNSFAIPADKHSNKRRGERPDPSIGRQRSISSHDESEMMSVHHHRHDSTLSRRSSSSRSNHDTGFASSSSSPRREDTISRFSSDISPSRYGEEDAHGHHPIDESVSNKRRSRLSMTNSNNNSLDVPNPTIGLRKDRSLSSSGRGDSSFEETNNDNELKAHPSNSGKHRNGNGRMSSSRSNLRNGDVESKRKPQITDNIRSNGGPPQTEESLAISPGDSSIQQLDSPKALSKSDANDWTSSTSTLRGVNLPQSKISLAGSISSLLSRDQPSRSATSEHSFSMSSVSEKWRKLREGITPDQNSTTSTFASGTASLLSSAAARFMSSLPKVSSTLPKTQPANVNTVPPAVATEKASSEPQSEPTKAPPVSSKPSSKPASPPQSLTSVPVNLQEVSSPRPSVVSTTLSTHNKRASAYAVMAEKTEEPETPDSEESGQMTPPPMDMDMKRRSKDVDMELTSFLPAEMSRREEKFHDAARVNDATAIRALVKEKVNVNCRNSLDRTALHWAAANGNVEAVEALIECRADLEAKDKYGMRAILWSAWFGHIPVLRALVNAGASTKIANKQGLTILHCAAENNHDSVISFIFESLEPHDVNVVDKNERTPLHAAAEHGYAEAVGRLLQANADIHKKDKGGMTAVHLAAKHGHVEVLKRLLLQGVEVDDRDVDGKTALHLAAEGGHKDIIDLLLDYTANSNSETVKEVTPLHLAAMEGFVDVCKSLVKYGCNVNAQNFQGNTALHLASNANHKEVSQVLIDAKCEVDLPNGRLQTALHIAVESGHLEVVQILLAGGASLDTREKSGKSALQLAARGNYVAVVDMLIKAERYYATARDYHDKDVGYVDPDSYLRHSQHPNSPHMKEILWKLATKQLKPTDWKKLAHYWKFTPEHIKAIEQEYTGTMSYKDHGYRLMLIWLHGIRKDENVLKLLFEALNGIEKRHLAESIRKKTNMHAEKPCSPTMCAVS